MFQDKNPFDIFNQWLDEAKAHPHIKEPTAMTVATASKAGIPNARILLLKKHDERGFCFFTNLTSVKGNELEENQDVTLCFYWMPLDKQIRIHGKVTNLPDNEADEYFASRPRGSQISAWASKQSKPMGDEDDFDKRVAKYEAKFEGGEVPRPDFWSGFRLVPESYEFWIGHEFRRHDRYFFTKSEDDWNMEILYP